MNILLRIGAVCKQRQNHSGKAAYRSSGTTEFDASSNWPGRLLGISCPSCPTLPDQAPCKPCLERRLRRRRLEASMLHELIQLRPEVRAEFGAQIEEVQRLFLKLSDDIARLAILREWRESGRRQC